MPLSTTRIRDTVWVSDQNTRKHHTQKSQDDSPFPAGDHKATRNMHDSIMKANKDSQKKHHLGGVQLKI